MNTEDLALAWQTVCTTMKEYDTINISQMDAFFSRICPQAMSDGFLALSADNTFIKANVERFYLNPLKQALREIYGTDFTIMIEVFSDPQTNNVAAPEPTPQSSPVPCGGPSLDARERDSLPDLPRPEEMQKESRQRIPAAQPIDRITEHTSVNNMGNEAITPVLTFENFVIGDSNRMAYSMALSVAEMPGQSTFLNPLFIYGKSGLGKTHLLRATQNYINETRPELSVIYTDSADLLADYVNAGMNREKGKNGYNHFKQKYEEADILLIDDIQFLQGKKQTLDIVFQIFNKMIDRGSQVILSADRAPKNIDIDERYQSRFNSGGTIDIQPPEIETKLGIIKSYIEEYNQNNRQNRVELSDEIQLYVAQVSSSNIRELKSAVTKIIFHMNFLNRKSVDLRDVKEILDNHFSGGPSRRLSIADIQKEVESFYKVDHSDLIGKKRERNISHARKVAIYLCRQMLDIPFSMIGKEFNKDHSTMIYSVTNIEEKMRESRELREEIDTLRQMIRES